MAMKSSMGLRNLLMGTSSFRAIFHGTSEMRVYPGPVPVNADAAAGTPLLVFRKDGTDPLGFSATVSGGVLVKDPAETWSAIVEVTGTAAYFRLVLIGDDNGASTTAPRVQGTVGLSGADLMMPQTAVIEGVPQPYGSASFSLPS